jgi:peptide chain release factor subunit 1
LEVEESMQLLEWFANNYKNFGTNLQIVTDKSQEGSQFCKGFGGIGGTNYPLANDGFDFTLYVNSV